MLTDTLKKQSLVRFLGTLGMKSLSTFGDRAFKFYASLELPYKLPQDVAILNPYSTPRMRDYVRSFLVKYFSDNRKRVLVFGINPGRFGAGITGVTFSDPIALEIVCGVLNDLPKKRELSSVFIYEFSKLWGGPRSFIEIFSSRLSFR